MHPAILGTLTLHWPDEAACEAFARKLAAEPRIRNLFVELHGPLGAGKTTFVRHLLRALGATGRIKSPTYAVMEPYELPGLDAWHFDFYRFDDPREWEDAGFREVLTGPGLKLVEWPDKAGDLLPVPDLRAELVPQHWGLSEQVDAMSDETMPTAPRAVTFKAYTPAGVALIEAVRS
jgi:tRNA threonylcarbamoyladenosine biosynthesis protein TsaE